MKSLVNIVPFSLQERFYRGLSGSLKYVIRLMQTIIQPPEVFAGPGASLLLCDALGSKGVKRVLLVTDAMLVKLGLVEPLRVRLMAHGIAVSIYDGVLPDPREEQIEEALVVLRRDRCEVVLAVGGGSVMDAGKVVAARATNDKSVLEMVGFFKVSNVPLPIYCIPTTAGTGSEVSVGAVVSDPVARRKLTVIDHKLAPRMAALDGNLMIGLPRSGTAATGMDALTHAVEAYISRIATPESDQLALEAVSLIMRHLPRVLANGADVESRQMMSWAAYRAGQALNLAGLGYVHGIAHGFGALYHTPHGWANAIVLPWVLDFSKPACIPRLAALARASGLAAEGKSEEMLAEIFIAHVRHLKQDCGIPEGLQELRVEDIPCIAEAAIQEAHFTYAVPRYMDKAVCEAVIRQMLV